MFTNDELKQRGLVFTGRFLPYNPDLIPRAKELRAHMTPAEKKLWFELLREYRPRFLRQHPIDNYIVDFYCPTLKLVIEIDGEHHYTDEGKHYDDERDSILAAYDLEVVRLKNEDVMDNFKCVRRLITDRSPRLLRSRPPF